MTKTKRPRYVSPAGTAQYPHLTRADTKFNPDGEYKTKLEIPAGEETNKLVAFLDEQFDAAVEHAKAQNAGKKIKIGELPYTINEDTGTVTVNFKLKAKGKTKDGVEFEQRPALFDAKGKALHDVNVGGGSVMKIGYEVIPYYTAIAGASITLRLKAAQILKLVEYSGGASAGAYGFGQEEGYEAEDNTVESNGFNQEEESGADF